MKKDIRFNENENKDVFADKEMKLAKKELDDNELESVAGGTDVIELFKTIKDIITK